MTAKKIKRDDIPQRLIEELCIFNGVPPHDNPGNFYRADGYFAHTINERYGERMVTAAMTLVIHPLQQELAREQKIILQRHLG